MHSAKYPEYLFVRLSTSQPGIHLWAAYHYSSRKYFKALSMAQKVVSAPILSVDDRVVIISESEKVYGQIVMIDQDSTSTAIDSNASFPIVCKVSLKTGIIKQVADE